MQDQPISQLPEAPSLLGSDLIVVVHNGETQKATVSALSNTLSSSPPTNGLSLSGTGEVQLGGTLLQPTSINQDGFPLMLQNGSLISTGTGNTPSLIGESHLKFAWLPDKYAFVAGSFNDEVWNDKIGSGSALFGFQNKCLGLRSAIFGNDNEVTSNGSNSLVIGTKNISNGSRSFIGGMGSSSNNWSNVLYGNNINSFGPFATAFGVNITVGEDTPSELTENQSSDSGFGSLSIGQDILNASDFGIALGTEHELFGNYAYAYGDKVKIEKFSNYSSGRGCLVEINERARFNTGIGNSVFINSGSEFSVALGSKLTLQSASGNSNGPKYSFLMGSSSKILSGSEFTFALGSSLNTSTDAGQSKFGLTVGSNNNLNGDFHVALGNNQTVQGTSSFTAGSYNNVNGQASYAFGISNTISSTNSGNSTNAFAVGRGNTIDASASFALGTNNNISTNSTPSTDSFAIGYSNNAEGRSSFAIGTETNAITDASTDFGGAYAIGNKANANGNNSFAYGKYVNSQNGAFVIGSGIEDPNLGLSTQPHTPTFLTNSNTDTLVIGFNSDIPTLFVDKANGLGTTGNVGIGTTTPTAKLHVNGDLLLENGTQVNEIKTTINSSSPSDTALVTEKAVVDIVKPITQYNFSLASQTNSTPGLLSKSLTNSNNPGALPTTNPFNPGINNGGIDPYMVIRDSNVKSLHIAFAQCAVGTGTVGSNVSLRLELFKMEYDSRTLIGTFDIPLDSSLVSVNNNLGTDNFQSAILDNLSTPLNAGDLIGLQFTNVSGNPDLINAVGRLYVGLETETI